MARSKVASLATAGSWPVRTIAPLAEVVVALTPASASLSFSTLADALAKGLAPLRLRNALPSEAVRAVAEAAPASPAPVLAMCGSSTRVGVTGPFSALIVTRTNRLLRSGSVKIRFSMTKRPCLSVVVIL